MGNDAAIVLNGEHSVEQSVRLNEVASNEVLVGVLFFGVVKRIALLDFLDFLDLFLLCLLDNSPEHELRIAREITRQPVVLAFMLCVQLGERRELEVG